MLRYVVRRTLIAVFLFFVITAFCFAAVHLAPGDPFTRIDPGTRQSDIERLKQQHGLDRPLWQQYASWMGGFLQGDLGRSFSTRQPVGSMITERLPATLELMGGGLFLSLVLGLGAGILGAVRQGGWWDRLAQAASLIGLSVPVFWLGILSILVFSVELGWFPTGGRQSLSAEFPWWNRLHHLLLPATVLALTQMPLWSRHMRSSLMEVLSEDHIRTARAKGLSPRQVIARHALRPALLPIVTLLGIQIPVLFTGAVITESVFQWPGIGRLFFAAVEAYDYPRLMGILAISTLLILAGNLASDLLNARLDPRIRLGERS